jgi:hypothetical protein
MTTLITRSFADNQGWNWPPEIAVLVDGQPITFAQLKADRVERQRLHMARFFDYSRPTRRAAYIWVFYVDYFIYGGWHLYLRTINDRWWIRRVDDHMAREIMELFPCGMTDHDFEAWKQAFAHKYPRVELGGQKQGMLTVWVDLDSGGRPTRITPMT